MTADKGIDAGLSPQQALIYAMVAVAAADRRIVESEFTRMRSMVRELPAFRGMDEAAFGREAQACGRELATPDGVRKVIRLVAGALAGGLRETAYVLAAEVAASDLSLRDDERSFLSLLAEGLQLDDLVCAALQRSVQARHRAV